MLSEAWFKSSKFSKFELKVMVGSHKAGEFGHVKLQKTERVLKNSTTQWEPIQLLWKSKDQTLLKHTVIYNRPLMF